MEIIQRIKQSLCRGGIENYRINIIDSRSTELFYIKKKIDITRDVHVTDYAVTVYRDFEADGAAMRGSADALVYSDMTDAEMDAEINRAYFAASFVKNKFYELPAPEKKNCDCVQGAEYDLTCEAFKMADAIFKAEEALSKTLSKESSSETNGSFINSAEIFAKRSDVRIINSNGIDAGYTQYSFSGEFVTQCIYNDQDVELHSQFAYLTPEYDSLTDKVKEALKNTRDRAEATRPPEAGRYAVVLSGAYVRELLGYYVSRSGGGMIYSGYSSFTKNSPVQGDADGSKGELLELKLKAVRAYSAEGIHMKDRVLTERGILKTIHSGARYAYYLGTEPTGEYSAIECANGTMPLESMCNAEGSENDRVLRIAVFSDFQMDEFSGRFGGEIRLAYLYEKDEAGRLNVSTLTGGSINGSILDAQGSLIFSKERYRDSKYEGPLAVRIDNVSVAGA